MPGALKQRERGDKVMAGRNIIKSELLHPGLLLVEQMPTVMWGERT